MNRVFDALYNLQQTHNKYPYKSTNRLAFSATFYRFPGLFAYDAVLFSQPRSPRQSPATHSLTTITHPRLIIRRRVRAKLPLHAERALEHAVRLPGHRRAERGRRVDALVALAARAGVADVGDDALRVGDFEGWGGG